MPRGERGGPNVLVLSPTRELALQVCQNRRNTEIEIVRFVSVSRRCLIATQISICVDFDINSILTGTTHGIEVCLYS